MYADENCEMSSDTLKLLCCAVRIGSLKIVPMSNDFFTPKTMPVYVNRESLSFEIPKLKSPANQQISEYELSTITLTKENVKKVYGYFGPRMFILFAHCMPSEAVNIIDKLGISPSKNDFYDPESSDETKKWITCFADHDELKENYDKFCSFFYKQFSGSSGISLNIISLKEANTLLISSTTKEFKVIQMSIDPINITHDLQSEDTMPGNSKESVSQDKVKSKNKSLLYQRLQENRTASNFKSTVEEMADFSDESSSLETTNSYVPSISSSENINAHSHKSSSEGINTLDDTFLSSGTTNLCATSLNSASNVHVNYLCSKPSFTVVNTSGLLTVPTLLITSIAPTNNNSITDNSCDKSPSTAVNILSDCSTSSIVNTTSNVCNSSGSWVIVTNLDGTSSLVNLGTKPNDKPNSTPSNISENKSVRCNKLLKKYKRKIIVSQRANRRQNKKILRLKNLFFD